MTGVCLLRGVNVGGHAKLPMPAFRTLLEELGARDVRTYVQSGNAVFDHALPAEAVRLRISAALAEQFGLMPEVLVLGAPELAEVVAAQPFAHDDPADAGALHVGFFVRPPGEDAALVAGDTGVAGRDEFVLGERAAYVRCPDGFGRTKLSGGYFERLLGVPVTFRNWRTVLTLAETARVTSAS
jgi:uncharacterized protein (DUF1697 family)